MKAGDTLWFAGIDDGDEKVPAQFATCTGRMLNGSVCATLASGRKIIWPRSYFRKVWIDTYFL